MKNSIRKLTALALVLAMVLSMSALAAKETPSKGFKLPAVKERATEAPAAPEAPAEGEESAAPEATEAPAEGEAPAPEATEAPAEETKPEPEVETVIGKAYVSLENADSTLNVRAAATTESDRLGSLNHGDEVSVLGYEGDWTKISFAGSAGYVKSSFLSDAPAAPEAPVEPEVTAEPEATEAPAEPEVTAEPEATEAPAEPEVTAEPEATEAPAEPEVTAEPEATEAPAEPEVTAEPEATEAPAEEAPSVAIRCLTSGDIFFGDEVTFEAIVEGDAEVSYQWQYSVDNANWQNVSGETGKTMRIVITEENAAYYWRVEVDY